MRVVKVDAISSTNSFLKAYIKKHPTVKPLCVVAENQIEGRGQRGSAWVSNPGENLTFSVYMPRLRSIYKDTFKLSALVALAIKNTLIKYDMPKVSIKWPNDILSSQHKISGILIENMMSQGDEGSSIVGIGLNVNQEEFVGLPKATSMKLMCDTAFDLDSVLSSLLDELETVPELFNKNDLSFVRSLYYKSLFRYEKVSMLQFPDGTMAQGLLKGIDNFGRLVVEFEDDRLESFDVKEIQIKY